MYKMKGLTIKNMNFEEGQIVNGLITGIKKYGIFFKLENNMIAFCHISKVSGGFISDLNKLYNINDTLKIKIINIKDNGQIEVSIKDVDENKYNVRSVHQNSFNNKHNDFNNKFNHLDKKKEPESFEDMLNAFMKSSESKLKDISLREAKRKR